MILPRLMSLASLERRPIRILPNWIGAFVLFSVLYTATMNTSIQGCESGYFVCQAYLGTWRNPLGLVAVHPLHYGLAHFLTMLNLMPPFTAVPLLSALLAAATVANVLAVVLLITRSYGAAAACAASLGVAHTFWRMATVAEVYTLTTLILSAELLCVLGFARKLRFRWLVVAFFLNGLGCSNHLQNGLSLPALLALIVAAVRRRPAKAHCLLVATAAWSFGSLPYTGLIASELAGGAGIGETVRSALVGHWSRAVFNVVPTKQVLFTVAFFPLYNFPNLLFPLAALGIRGARRLGLAPTIHGYILITLALHVLFVVRYSVTEQYAFFLPIYMFLTVLAGIGWRALEVYTPASLRYVIRVGAAVLIVATPLVYAVVPPLARRVGVLNNVVKNRPYDDAYRRLLVPWSCVDRAVHRTTEKAFELAGANGLILVEDFYQHAFGLIYFRDRGKLSNVLLLQLPSLDAPGRRELLRICDEAARGHRAVVLVPAVRGAPSASPPGGRWRPADDLYVLESGY